MITIFNVVHIANSHCSSVHLEDSVFSDLLYTYREGNFKCELNYTQNIILSSALLFMGKYARIPS